MDEIDVERFRRGTGLLGPDAGPPHAGVGRAEACLGADGKGLRVEVRGLDGEAHSRIRDELQLLVALEMAGIAAAPSVLEIEDDGYLREAAPPLEHRAGRRVATDGAPPTAERVALARARDDLDDLIDALHQRGWVLGAAPGQGLGVRSDGSVVVLELDGLRREEALAAHQADRRWVDSVLQDQERTLRRRIDLTSPARPVRESALFGAGAAAAAQEESADGVAEYSSALEPSAPEAAEHDAAGSDKTEPDKNELVGTELVGAELVGAELDGAEPGGAQRTEGAYAGTALPPPRRIRRREREQPGRAENAHEGSVLRIPGLVTRSWRRGRVAIAQVLSQPPLRRVAVGSALVVLLLGSTAAAGAWWISEQPAQAPSHEQSRPGAESPSTSPTSMAAPQVEDPWALVADVAGARHAYVTGVSEQPAAVPDSEAFAVDEQTRIAYRDFQVRGGGPVVHEAELLETSAAEGTVVLRAVTSTAEHELEDEDGVLTLVPATAPRDVRLVLEWDGERWLVQAAEPWGADAEAT